MNHPLHRGGFPPISDASIGKALKDGRAYARFDGPPRHIRIGDPVQDIRDRLNAPHPWLDIAAKSLIVFLGVVSLALWVL